MLSKFDDEIVGIIIISFLTYKFWQWISTQNVHTHFWTQFWCLDQSQRPRRQRNLKSQNRISIKFKKFMPKSMQFIMKPGFWVSKSQNSAMEILFKVLNSLKVSRKVVNRTEEEKADICERLIESLRKFQSFVEKLSTKYDEVPSHASPPIQWRPPPGHKDNPSATMAKLNPPTPSVGFKE